MDPSNKQISKLKFYSFLFAFILLLQIIGVAFFLRNSNRLHSASLNQINSLISEVGTLKEENLLLNTSLNQEKNLNQLNEQTIRQIYLSVAANQSNTKDLQTNLLSYQNFLENERRKLSAEKTLLNTTIQNQQNTIQQLKQKEQSQAASNELNDKIEAILFLGENQKLTDTIQLAIINPQKQQTTLISIPRDLYFEGRKINEYYKFYGIEKTAEVINKITNIKIDHYVSLNFQAFIELIDLLGGLDIQVDKALLDNAYPTATGGYKTVSFTPGLEHMTGERALEYARSRKSTSDFDRSLRQQKILQAIRDKLASLNIMKNIQFYLTAFQSLQKNLQTDFNVLEAIELFEQHKATQLSTGHNLSNSNYLYSSTSLQGQSILLPKDGNFQAFQKYLTELVE